MMTRVHSGLIKICKKTHMTPAEPCKFRTPISSFSPHGDSVEAIFQRELFKQGIIEAGCMAHARRKFHKLYANHKSQIAGEALKLFGVLYDVERQVEEFDADARRAARQQLGRPAADTLHAWLL